MQAPWQKLGFQLKLGLRPRQESCWLPRENLFGNDTERDEQIRQKQHLFAHNHADIFAASHLPAPPAQRCYRWFVTTSHHTTMRRYQT